jgi:hypothetical protein
VKKACWLAVGAAVLTMSAAHQAAAMRYVEFNIKVNNRLVLRASVGDSGHEDEATVWRYLKRLPVRSMNGYRVNPDPGQPLRATLKGKIHLSSPTEHADLTRLRLVRESPQARWKLAPAEVDRTFKLRKPG